MSQIVGNTVENAMHTLAFQEANNKLRRRMRQNSHKSSQASTAPFRSPETLIKFKRYSTPSQLTRTKECISGAKM